MKTDKEVKKSPVPAIIRGLFTAIIITLTVFLISAAVMTYGGGLSENAVNTTVYITSLVSVLAGSILTAAALKQKGLIDGIIVGLLYIIFMIFVGYIIVPDFALSTKTAAVLIFSLAGGAIGGVIGVNIIK